MLKKMLSLFMLAWSLSSAAVAVPEVGDMALDVQLPYVDGDYRSIITLNPGQSHTIIEFSSYNCVECRKSVPQLNNLAQRLADRAKVQLIMLNNKSKCELFLQELGVNLPTAYDPDFLAFDAYDVIETPHLFVVNQKQKIIYAHKGRMTHDVKEHIYHLVMRN
ncbi:MAG: TlpA family protein disulfide reductase [Oligoflexales bacterium]